MSRIVFPTRSCVFNGRRRNPRPRPWIGVGVVAAGLLLTGCGSSVGAATVPAPVATTATGATAAPPSVGMVTASTTSTAATASTLDEGTYQWFDTFCTGMTPLVEYLSGGFSDTGDTPRSETEQGQDMSDAGRAFQATAEALSSVAAPGFPAQPGFLGGSEFAELVVAGLQDLGEVFITAGDAKAAGDENWADAFESEVVIGASPLDRLSEIEAPEELRTAVAAIPSCAAIGITAEW